MEITENMQSAIDWFTGAPLNITLIVILAITISLLGQRSITRFMSKVASADLIPGPKRSGIRQKERAKTTSSVLKSTLNGGIWLIAIFMILS
ncbi:MAG: small-conductance mechanosensitive channel, partial [Actinobacteria bacterium]|nr:small-conductance mechanosensitive channel [Actinomycetota bacterium]